MEKCLKSSPVAESKFDTPDEYERKFAWVWRVLYGMKMVTFEAGDTDYKIWKRGCADLSTEELDQGVRLAKDFDGNWFSLNKFRALCKKDDFYLGLPTAKQAYYEACLAKSPKAQQKYTHAIVFYAGAATGWHELASFAECDILPRFEANYEVLLAKLKAGEDISMKIPEMLARKSVVYTEEQRQKNIQRMKTLLTELKGNDQ